MEKLSTKDQKKLLLAGLMLFTSLGLLFISLSLSQKKTHPLPKAAEIVDRCSIDADVIEDTPTPTITTTPSPAPLVNPISPRPIASTTATKTPTPTLRPIATAASAASPTPTPSTRPTATSTPRPTNTPTRLPTSTLTSTLTPTFGPTPVLVSPSCNSLNLSIVSDGSGKRIKALFNFSGNNSSLSLMKAGVFYRIHDDFDTPSSNWSQVGSLFSGNGNANYQTLDLNTLPVQSGVLYEVAGSINVFYDINKNGAWDADGTEPRDVCSGKVGTEVWENNDCPTKGNCFKSITVP